MRNNVVHFYGWLHDAQPGHPLRVNALSIAHLILALTIAGAMLIAVLSLAPLNSSWSERKIAESQHRAAIIVDSLHSYYQNKGHYPADLQELVPIYCPSLPLPVAGNLEWDYVANTDGSTFSLAFRRRPYSSWAYYYSDDRGWEHSDGF